MKKVSILAAFAATMAFTACNSSETAENTNTAVATETSTSAEGGDTYQVVADQSEVKWHGTKVAGEHNGNINVQSGELTIADNALVGGTIVIDMNSITNADITDAENNGKLVGHLKSDDFFGVEAHPTATFNITNATPIAGAAAGAPNYNVEGTLTVKGNTNPVTFPATVTVDNGVATAAADVKVDRSKYDVRYGSNSFFDNLGDKAISDEFTISFNVTARE